MQYEAQLFMEAAGLLTTACYSTSKVVLLVRLYGALFFKEAPQTPQTNGSSLKNRVLYSLMRSATF